MAGKTANGWIGYVSIAVVILITIFVLSTEKEKKASQQGGQPTASPSTVETQTVQDGLNSYGLNGLRNDWPEMTDVPTESAQNKLAKNYYVILDDSGSMKSNECAQGYSSKLSAAIDALAAFAEGMPAQANLGVLSFSLGNFRELLPLGKHTTDEIRQLAQRVTADGNTPLATAITRGYYALSQQARTQLGYGEYHLVVITDGAASDGEYPDAIINQILTESPVDVHTIGFCIGTAHVLNQPRYLSYQAANNAQALRQGLQEVLAESPAFTVSSFE